MKDWMKSLVVAAGVLVAYGRLHQPPEPKVTVLPGDVKVVEVPVKTIEPRDVVKYVSDPIQAQRLLDENRALGAKVDQLAEIIATYKPIGTGPVVEKPTTSEPTVLQPSGQTKVADFQDWRLHFVSDGKNARYQLTQTFEVLSTSGRDKAGKPVNAVRMFELGPAGQRLPVSDVKTTVVRVDETVNHWYTHLNVQAGVVVSVDTTGKQATGAVFGAQWLKRGRTTAPGDTRWAFATPVVMVSSSTTELGVMPLSFNAGTLPYQPFTNIWLSPFVGVSVTNRAISRGGVALTATF